jgi:nicotinamidase-related amidase
MSVPSSDADQIYRDPIGVVMRPALLVVDIQKSFFDFGPAVSESLRNAIACINPTIALFRKHNLPVICIQHVDKEEGLTPDAGGFESPKGLDILPSDLHIHKTYGNAFNKTALAVELQAVGIDTVIITGFCAENCVLSTYRGAEDVDLTPIILRNSLASGSRENIRFVETISSLISFGALEKVLEGCT